MATSEHKKFDHSTKATLCETIVTIWKTQHREEPAASGAELAPLLCSRHKCSHPCDIFNTIQFARQYALYLFTSMWLVTFAKSSLGMTATRHLSQSGHLRHGLVFRVKMFHPKASPQYTPNAAQTTAAPCEPTSTVSTWPSSSSVYLQLAPAAVVIMRQSEEDSDYATHVRNVMSFCLGGLAVPQVLSGHMLSFLD